MKEEYSLELLFRGKKFAVYWLNMSQSLDFKPVYNSLNKNEQNKLNALITLTANAGPGKSKEKWRLLETGLFEMKSGSNRALFIYHDEVRKAIVITHMFIKKQKKCPPRELERARKRREIANRILPDI